MGAGQLGDRTFTQRTPVLRNPTQSTGRGQGWRLRVGDGEGGRSAPSSQREHRARSYQQTPQAPPALGRAGWGPGQGPLPPWARVPDAKDSDEPKPASLKWGGGGRVRRLMSCSAR